MADSNKKFRLLGILSIAVFLLAAIITFCGPNPFVYGKVDPLSGKGFWFAVFYVFALLSSVGLVLNRSWSRYLFGFVAVVILVRGGWALTKLIKALRHPLTGLITTYVEENGKRRFNLVVSFKPDPTCDRVGLPVWSINVAHDVMSMKAPLSFPISQSEEANAMRFNDNFGDGIAAKTGKLFISRIDKDKSMSGWFNLLSKNGRSLHYFHAVWCGQKIESEALKEGAEQHRRRLRQSNSPTSR